jgi:hypothetical protein
LVSGSAWVSMLGALLASVVGSSIYTWLSHKWSERLNDRLSESAAEILGISSSASKREIESAFRRLARDCHPDKQGGSSGREFFELISVSKEILLHRIQSKARHGDSKSSVFKYVSSFVHSFLNVTVPQSTVSPVSRQLPAYYLDSPD